MKAIQGRGQDSSIFEHHCACPQFNFDQTVSANEQILTSGERVAVGVSPYASFFAWLLFLYDYEGRHHLHLRPPVIGRTVTAEDTAQSHSPVAKEASPAKDVSPVVATAKAGAKKSKHYKPKVFARQRDNAMGTRWVMPNLGTARAVSFSADPRLAFQFGVN